MTNSRYLEEMHERFGSGSDEEKQKVLEQLRSDGFNDHADTLEKLLGESEIPDERTNE